MSRLEGSGCKWPPLTCAMLVERRCDPSEHLACVDVADTSAGRETIVLAEASHVHVAGFQPQSPRWGIRVKGYEQDNRGEVALVRQCAVHLSHLARWIMSCDTGTCTRIELPRGHPQKRRPSVTLIGAQARRSTFGHQTGFVPRGCQQHQRQQQAFQTQQPKGQTNTPSR
jgi:hypothetical protein